MRYEWKMGLRTFWTVMVSLILAVGLHAQSAPFPMLPGEAIATCYSGSNPDGYVVALFDLRDPKLHAMTDVNWTAPSYHGETPPSPRPWAAGDFQSLERPGRPLGDGEVFGVALDDQNPPNIYLTSTSSYPFTNNDGRGEVFKIDGQTGAVSLFLDGPLSNSGQGLGNIAFDAAHQQFFVTNFHDGKIYRVSIAGAVNPVAFDPFVVDSPTNAAGFVSRDERPWGLGVFNGRLYFGTWAGVGADQYFVHSVAISAATGALTGSVQGEVKASSLMGAQPISDIAFSDDGRMFVAERGMAANDQDPNAHNADVVELVQGDSGWMPDSPPHMFEIGIGVGKNSAGGVDHLCAPNGEHHVVVTGDALHLGSNDAIYGLQLFPDTGGKLTNSYLIDLDGDINAQDKRQIGDVEAYDRCEGPCLETVDAGPVLCEEDGSFTFNFQFRNLTPDLISHVFLVEPMGATVTPSYFNLAASPISSGQLSPVLTVKITGAMPSSQISFLVTIHNDNFEMCCSYRLAMRLPNCECGQLLPKSRACKYLLLPPSQSGFTYSFEIENLESHTVKHLLLAPKPPATFTIQPNHFPTMLQPFQGTGPLNVTVTGPGSTANPVCFLVGLFDATLSECCAVEQCVSPQACIFIPNEPEIFQSLGQATILFSETEARIEGIGDSGEDGVAVDLRGGFGTLLHWRDLDPRNDLATGATLWVEATGTSGGTERSLGSLRVVDDGQRYRLNADFAEAGGGSAHVEVFHRNRLVATVENATGELAQLDQWPSGGGAGRRQGRPVLVLRLDDTLIHLTSGPSVVADQLVVRSSTDVGVNSSFAKLRLRAASIPQILLLDVSPTFDCNENGVEDEVDLAGGISTDDDGNGVLDECEQEPEIDPRDLSLVLNTGFDQDAGTVLPPGQLPAGTADDDWQVVQPNVGAAKVVINPVAPWPPALPESQWISVNPDRGLSVPGSPVIRFERCFCLSAATESVSLLASLFADDSAVVYLNGQAISDPIGAFIAGVPETMSYFEDFGTGLLVPGENCLAVEVLDTGGVVTGLDLVGSLVGDDANCAAP